MALPWAFSQALVKLDKFPALMCEATVPSLQDWAYYLRIEPKDEKMLWLVRAMMETELPKPWTCYKGIGSIVCYLRSDSGQATRFLESNILFLIFLVC